MIAIYTPYHSNRTKYVLDYIFKQQLGLEYVVFNSVDQVSDTFTIRLNYSEKPILDWLHIIPHGILSEKGINRINSEFKIVNSLPVIFANTGAIGFDIFGAVFYCLSRYEEYYSTAIDKHNRFSYKESFLFRNNYLQTPLVDYWVRFFHGYLIQLYPERLQLNSKVPNTIVPTIDIDSVFVFKGKGIKRQLGGVARDLINAEWGQLNKRISVLALGEKDPYDNFDYQFDVLRKNNLKANYFIQVGRHGEYDKNIRPYNKKFQSIIKRILADGHEVGLHPSYQSFYNIDIIQKEKEVLENIIGQAVTQSRQHYLRFSLPRTYEDLITLGIKKEFSMGYSEVPGYRASTSLPFNWYDLQIERSTELEIHPFSMMDVAFKEFMKLSIDESLQFSNKMREQLKEVKGQFCFVYHNESLSDYGDWKNWRTVFESWLQQ